jgi:acylphosphatase
MAIKKHLAITITGKVQGVFFRASAKETADDLGLNGFVRNEPDGRVYIEVEGDDIILEQFLEWCWQGPPRARIDKMDVQEGKAMAFAGFEVRR